MKMRKHMTTTAFILLAAVVFSLPLAAENEIIKLEAIASFYADEFHGRPTSSGEIFDMNALTAAHKNLPFGTMLEVTNLENGKRVVVRVNDRGPFVENRELDVSRKAAEMLGMIETGVARVSIRKIDSFNAAAIAAGASPETGSSTKPAAVKPAAAPITPQAPTTVEVPNPPSISEPLPVSTPAEDSSRPSPGGNALISWRIQLGAFSREDNATRMVVRLRKDGFNPVFESSGDLTRVVIPGIPDSELSGTRTRLDRAGYTGYIVRKDIR